MFGIKLTLKKPKSIIETLDEKVNKITAKSVMKEAWKDTMSFGGKKKKGEK